MQANSRVFEVQHGFARALRPRRCLCTHATAAAPSRINDWLSSQGAPEQALELSTREMDGRPLDVSVARRDIKAGEKVLCIPDHLVVTLDRVFDDSTVAEVLTTGKFSELACLTLYLMYEKKLGRDSVWYDYIKELDRVRARGPQAAESPILWTEAEIEDYLQGSPLRLAVRNRLERIRAEYTELDTVWFMSGSLFNKYPYDVPTEAFSFELFRQAFAAVQASVVHLQGVPLARRFALVPLGPPSLQYASTCKAIISHDEESQEVTLTVDRDYAAGERVLAWCGPQPNSRLLLNYGIVDETNPYNKWIVTATIPNRSLLFQAKRRKLETASLSTKQDFKLVEGAALPEQLIPFLRVCYCQSQAELDELNFKQAAPVMESDRQALMHLVQFLHARLCRYARTLEEDQAVLDHPDTPPRQKVACRLLIAEKGILIGARQQVLDLLQAPADFDLSSLDPPDSTCVEFS